MDLTGTSLADVLPLEAPCWEGVGLDEPVPLLAEPSGWYAREQTLEAVDHRRDPAWEDPGPRGVPFLNDHLLFADEDWDAGQDVRPAALGWRLAGGPENLRVLPSSPLPGDVAQAVPIIFDEEHAAYLESRLEYLLAAIAEDFDEAWVVVDVPPTLPGLSRAVVSLGLRLGGPTKVPLAWAGEITQPLEDATICWQVLMVTTRDLQDLRAVARWYDLVEPDLEERFRVVVNRVEQGDRQELLLDLPKHLEKARIMTASLHDPLWFEERKDLRLFEREACPEIPDPFEDLDALLALVERGP